MQSRDTIPRLHQLVAHMRDFLLRLRNGRLTFEEARRGYAGTVSRLATAGKGRQTASRVSDSEAYWSPTAEVIDEAMRLGFVIRQPLPSARRHLDAHRSTSYQLTDQGLEAATLGEADPTEFTSYIADAAITAHPYFRSLLLLLKDGPLICPEVREGDLESAKREGRATAYWAEWSAERIGVFPGSRIAPADVKAEIEQAIRKRFGANPVRPPTKKAIAEAINDAFVAASLRSRGLEVGATNLRVLKAWGAQLLLLDESRYVPHYRNSNVVWLASELSQSDRSLFAKRRGIQQYGGAVARAIVAAYHRQAEPRSSQLITIPYLPIHEVRAEASFNCGVTRALADMVLERLAAGGFPELRVQVWLHLSGGEIPASEPVYRREGTRRFSMTMARKAEEEK